MTELSDNELESVVAGKEALAVLSIVSVLLPLLIKVSDASPTPAPEVTSWSAR